MSTTARASGDRPSCPRLPGLSISWTVPGRLWPCPRKDVLLCIRVHLEGWTPGGHRPPFQPGHIPAPPLPHHRSPQHVKSSPVSQACHELCCSPCSSEPWRIVESPGTRQTWISVLSLPSTASFPVGVVRCQRSNQSTLKEINPEYSLEGLMLKLQYFCHLM